jgi:hypothetical protein
MTRAPSSPTNPPSVSVPGNNNIIIFGNQNTLGPRSEAQDTNHIYQVGIIVGTVFGARRSPTNATLVEFAEITHANQLDLSKIFIYQGISLHFINAKYRTRLEVTRPQDGTIFYNVTAEIVDAPQGPAQR